MRHLYTLFHTLLIVISLFNVLSIIGLRGYVFEISRNLTALYLLFHFIQAGLVFFVSYFSYVVRTLLFVTLCLLSLFYIKNLFPDEEHVPDVQAFQFSVEGAKNIPLGEGMPMVFHKKVKIKGLKKIDVFSTVTLPFYGSQNDLKNNLYLRRLATIIRHLEKPFLLNIKMYPQPASRRYHRISRLRLRIRSASSENILERAGQVFTLQPRNLLFYWPPRLLSDPRIREALQNSIQKEVSPPVPQELESVE